MGTLLHQPPEVGVSQRCLLFVDDEQGLLDLYSSAFSRQGYRVVTATTLAAAREMLEQTDVDLIVLDIRLDEGSGLELLREIKAGSPDRPVVLNTAYARYKDDFASWLADAYVVKSSDLEELKSVVCSCLEAR
jgi:DNA-binding response OmpR family regulator